MIRTVFFLLLFCLDIRVKAETAVASGSRKRDWSGGGLTVTMLPGALLEQRDGETVQLVKGRFFIEFKNGASARTPYAAILCSSETCWAMISRSEEGMEVKALKGEFSVRRLGDQKHYGLIAGSRIYVSSVTRDGFAEMEFPQSLPWDATVKEWAKFYPGNAKEFRPVLARFRADWKRAVEVLSGLHGHHARREIASYEKEQAEERARRAAREREDAKLRELFRKKTFEQ